MSKSQSCNRAFMRNGLNAKLGGDKKIADGVELLV
jgi:hypothetical protein